MPLTITEFLEARIAEDEGHANGWCEDNSPCYVDNPGHKTPDRILAECAAKRKVAQYGAGLRLDRTRDSETGAQHRAVHWIMQQMARVYADHPDYREEW